MFNPYSTRPIGSPQYEDHLLDVMTSKHYLYQIPCDDDLEKLANYGEKIWKSEQEIDPMEKLAMAVTIQAVVDYINYYKKWRHAIHEHNSRFEVYYHSYMLDLENNFFRKYEITESAFDKLLKLLEEERYQKTWHSASYVIDQVLNNYTHFCKQHEMIKTGGIKEYGKKTRF